MGSRGGRSNDAHAKNKVQETFFSQQLKKAEDEKATVTCVAIKNLAAAARPLPTEQQYLELSWWLAKSFVEQAFEVVYYHHFYLLHAFELNLGLDKQEPKSDIKKALKTAWVEHNFDSKVSPMATHLNILFGLSEQYFHACNVNNVQQACRVDLHTPHIIHKPHKSYKPHKLHQPHTSYTSPQRYMAALPRHRPNGSWLRSSPTRGSLYRGALFATLALWAKGVVAQKLQFSEL